MDRFDGDECIIEFFSSGDFVLSRKFDSYGLKLDLGVSLDEPFDKVELLPGDNLSLESVWDLWCPEDEELDDDFEFFSMFANSLGFGEASAPIALHVCASKASGLFFESNCGKEREKEKC